MPDEKDGSELVIFTAKKFITMNPTWPEATHVAVHKGRIVAVGMKKEDMRPWVKRAEQTGIKTRYQHLEGCVLPGFIEPHIHPIVGGVALSLPCIAYHGK